MSELEQRMTLTTTLLAEETAGPIYRVTVIAAGPANGYDWTPDVLADATERGLFADLPSFLDHRYDPTVIGTRSVRDLCGMVYDGYFDAQAGAVRGFFRPVGALGAWVDRLIHQMLADQAAGRPVPPLGLSIDVSFAATGRRVDRIARVHAADVVYNPAAGGAFEARLADPRSIQPGETFWDWRLAAEALADDMTSPFGVGDCSKRTVKLTQQEENMTESMEVQRTRLVEQAQVPPTTYRAPQPGAALTPPTTLEQAASQALLLQQCQATLNTVLAASDLPGPLKDEIYTQFEGRFFMPADLQAALETKRATWAALAQAGVIRGVGMADAGQPSAAGRPWSGMGHRPSAISPSPSTPYGPRSAIQGMSTEMERIQAAVDRLFGLPLSDAWTDVPRLSGIRELYHLVTGDYNLYGVFDHDRATLANANATTMASLVANAMNKVIPARSAELGRAGYDWWKRVVHEEDFTTLQDIRWITIGGFGDLPTVNEGAAYTELAWDDNAETTAWTKKGGYLGLTLEMIDRDETRRVRQIPNLLATAAIRTLSNAVATLFTQNSGAGPDLADGTALFHASRGNVATTALTATSWDTAVQTMYKITELNSGKRLGIRPRYLLVPIELEKTALQIFVSTTEPSSNVFYENVRRSAAENVIPVPEWSDANDWAAVADPMIAPGIGVAYRYGRTPEVFVSDQPEIGSMFTNDELRVKVRFFYGVGVVDYRPLYKSNVA